MDCEFHKCELCILPFRQLPDNDTPLLIRPICLVQCKFSDFQMQFHPTTPQNQMRGTPLQLQPHPSVYNVQHKTFNTVHIHRPKIAYMHFEIIIVQQNGQLNSPNADHLKYEMCLLKDAMALPHISHSHLGSVRCALIYAIGFWGLSGRLEAGTKCFHCLARKYSDSDCGFVQFAG